MSSLSERYQNKTGFEKELFVTCQLLVPPKKQCAVGLVVAAGIFGDWDLALQVPTDRGRSAPAE